MYVTQLDLVRFVNAGATRFQEQPIILWPEFSNNFNAYWTRRADVFDRWRHSRTPMIKENILVSSPAEKRLVTQLPNPTVEAPLVVRNPDEYAAMRVMEAEMVELSERLRQARLQLEEERQKRHQIRDDYDESRRILEEERNKHRDTTKQLVILQEDQMTHQIQVSRLREQIEQNMSLKESLQLDLDRTRMQLHHAKEKYEAALNSVTAENEALRKRLDLTQVELQQSTSGSANKRDLIELESQNAVLRQVVDRYRRAMPSSRFGEAADAASSTAFDSPKLLSQSDFVNALMEALDRTKFLNKQMLIGTDQGSNWSKQSWQDLCVGWREAVVELCDLFASAHRIESLQSGAQNNSS